MLALMKRDTEIAEEIARLHDEQIQCKNEMAEIRMSPFKIGDDVMCEVSAGRTRKLQKCVIEVEEGIIYVRPYKSDGELSNRHFMIFPVNGNYSDYFKKV